MKPAFALSLSFEGIVLMYRAPDGWRTVGEVALDSPDLSGALADLRAQAEALDDAPICCKLIIPDEQIRYLTVDTGLSDMGTRDAMVRAALTDATPYDIEELVYDLSRDGTETRIAAVTRTTLDEAEAFAVEHGFNPVSFIAVAAPEAFGGEPFFGATRSAGDLSTPVRDLERDSAPTISIGPIEPPRPTMDEAGDDPLLHVGVTEGALPDDAAGDDPSDSPNTASDSASDAPEDTAAPVLGQFASRRGKTPEPKTAPATLDDQTTRAETGPTPEDVVTAVPASRPTIIARRDLPEVPQAEPVSEPAAATPGKQPLDRLKSLARALPGTAARTPVDDPAQTEEARRMTVFGARNAGEQTAPRRHPGLIVTAALLVLLAGIGAWAALFDGSPLDGIRGGNRTALPEAESASSETSTAGLSTSPTAPTTPQAETGATLTAPVSEEAPVALSSLEPGATGLSDTDAAVLDALRAPPEPDSAPVGAPAENEAEALYAATGIWQRAPAEPETPAVIGLNDLFLGSIDNRDLSRDAVALPSLASLTTDQSLSSLSSPAAPDTSFDLGPGGLVKPTPEGALSPEGVRVYLGKPPVVPPATPTRFESAPEETDLRRERLSGLRPLARPADLAERTERNQLGGLTRQELAGLRPKQRPRVEKTEAEKDETATAQAVAASPRPDSRPKNFSRVVARAEKTKPEAKPGTARETGTIAPKTVTPKIPSKTSVTRQATLENAINLRKLNLIGVYGTPSNRRALVRLPSGRYKKVRVGDSIDGGRVSAIGDSELRYQKGGRNVVLKIPSG